MNIFVAPDYCLVNGLPFVTDDLTFASRISLTTTTMTEGCLKMNTWSWTRRASFNRLMLSYLATVTTESMQGTLDKQASSFAYCERLVMLRFRKLKGISNQQLIFYLVHPCLARLCSCSSRNMTTDSVPWFERAFLLVYYPYGARCFLWEAEDST